MNINNSPTMPGLAERAFANFWNKLITRSNRAQKGGLVIGEFVTSAGSTKRPFSLSQTKRAEHLVVLGKTGSGKSYLLRNFCIQDIATGHGFVYFDHHGDTLPFLLAAMAEDEARSGRDWASRVVIVRPGDGAHAVGLNVLAAAGDHETFVQAASLTAILKERWGMEHFGARTEELLRNTLFALINNQYTLLEITAFLSNDDFRRQCVSKITNRDVRDYFQDRFEPLSDAMKAVMRDPILNKTSEFTSDPHFKFILGQRSSTFSFLDVLNEDKVLLVDLNRGRLGKHGPTLGSLILAQLRPAIFRRTSRKLFTVYADEVQNLLTSDTDFDVYFAEARKFGVSICTANQFLDQFPKRMRAAVQAIGTHIFFQLSSGDAQEVAQQLDGGRSLSERLKNLPKRELICKTGHYPWSQLRVPEVVTPTTNYASLVARSQDIYAKPCEAVTAEIEQRRPNATNTEVLNEWD